MSNKVCALKFFRVLQRKGTNFKDSSVLSGMAASCRVMPAVILTCCAFGAQATVEQTGQDAQVQGRSDQYNWQWDEANSRHVIDIVPEAASSIRSDTSGTPLQSVLRSYGFEDMVSVFLKTNNAKSSVVYESELHGGTNSSPDGTQQGPSIYSVFGFYADTDSDGYETRASRSPDIRVMMQPLWLDVYAKHESGYIFMENKGNTPEYLIGRFEMDDDLVGTYGWGFVPGIINVVNSGWSQPCGGNCGTGFTYSAYRYGLNSGDITFTGTGNQSSEINVQQVMFYRDTAVPDAMSIALPWRAAGAAISLTSNGGNGAAMSDYGIGGGDGGSVNLTLQDYTFYIAPHQPLATPDSRDYGVYTSLNVVSKGGSYGFSSVLSDRYMGRLGADPNDKGLSGDGGDVNVTLTRVRILSCGGVNTDYCNASDSTYATNKIIGLNAASLGGSTQGYVRDTRNDAGFAVGVGGDVSVTLGDGTVINLPFNNSVGLVATSSSDQTLLYAGTRNIYGLPDGDVPRVTVELLKGSEVLVGQRGTKPTDAAAGDTNIAVLANSSGSWGRELFTGVDLPHTVPGIVGDVEVTNLGKITAYGPNAIGVLAQSIGGTSISSPSAGASKSNPNSTQPVGDGQSSDINILATDYFGSDGGSVTYKSTYTNSDGTTSRGGSVTAEGHGASGLLLQSIGGGGGAGGDSTGLFVAVGGAGGRGGHGGELDVTLDSSTVTTIGDYAKGVVGHTIGGGGGNGGFAKSFGILFDVGVGGSGGAGGDGGGATFHATNSQVTTIGQHAYGVAFQSIGGGGGTGGAAHNADVGLGITVNVGVGGSGGGGGAGGDLDVSIDYRSSIVTTGLDSHGVLLQSISGGGGAGGAASGSTYNIGSIPEVPFKIGITTDVGGKGGSSGTAGKITVTNGGLIATSGAGAHGLVLQSIGGGGGHGADSTAGTNSYGDFGTNPALAFTASVSVGGSGGAAGSGGAISLTNTGTIATAGHNAVGLLVHSIGGGGGTAGIGNAYTTSGWFGNNKGDDQATTMNITTNVGAGGNGGSAGDGGDVMVNLMPDRRAGFTTIGSGSSGVVVQSIGGGGGLAGDAGTQAVNGGKVAVAMQLGGAGGGGGDGGSVGVQFAGNIQTGAVTQLQYTDESGAVQTSSPVAIGGSSHGIVAQSIGGGGGMGGNADPSTALVPELDKLISNWPKPVQKVLNIKGGIEFWAKRVLEDEDKRPTFGMSYSADLKLGGAGGVAGDGGNVSVDITDKSDITTYGHHSYGILAQSVGGGGGAGGNASSKSILADDIKASKLGSSFSVGMTVDVGGRGGASGDGGEVSVLISNMRDSNYVVAGNPVKGNYLRTGGYASHVVFAQSVGGGGGVGHEGSIMGLSSIQGWKTPGATLGSVSEGVIAAGNGRFVTVGGQSDQNYVTGWIESAGDASSLIFAQSIGGGGGTISFGCTTNGTGGTGRIKQSACFTDAEAIWNAGTTTDFSAEQFVNSEQKFDMTLHSNGGTGGDVSIYVGDSRLETVGDRAIAIVAQSIGGGGGYISADALNIGTIKQATPSSAHSSTGGTVTVELAGGKGGSGTAYVSTYGDGAWGVLAQSIGGGGGFFGDPALDIVGLLTAESNSGGSSNLVGGGVSVNLVDAIIATRGTNAHAIVAQSWSNGGGVFSGSSQSEGVIVRMGTKLSGNASGDNQVQYDAGNVTVSLDSRSKVSATGNGAIAILAQGGSADITIDGSVTGGKTYTNTNPAAKNRVVQGVGVMIAAGGTGSNTLTIGKGGVLTTVGGTQSGYAIMAGVGQTNVTNSGTVTGSVDLGSNPGTFTNESGGVLNKGAVYKVGNNSLHNYGTINIGDEDSVGTTNLEGRIVQHDTGRFMVTLDALGEQTSDRLIVDGTAVIGGTIHKRAKSLLPGNYEFLTATDLTLTAQAADRLLYTWEATVSDGRATATPTRAFQPEGLSLSPTSQNLVSYLERAWDNADRHHGELFGYKHELQGIEDYNNLLETLGGQALNAQPLQMRMAALSGLGDSLACPVITPVGLRLEQDNCVWARLTGDLTELSSNSQNLGFRASGGGLRIGMQHGLSDGWTVGAALGYNLNYLTSTNFTSNGQFFDLSLSAKRDVGQWSFGGALGYAQGWFSNNRRLSMPDAGIASGFNEQYTSRSQLSIYGAKFRAAYTFEQESHYIRPYVDLDVAYSRAPGYSESGPGKLALQMNSASQWNVGITPMLEFGTDVQADDGTRFKVFVSAGATFLPNNKQTSAASFVGASDLNGTFDVVNGGPNVLGRLNFGAQIYAKEGYEVRAQYGLQAGQNYWSQNLSVNFTYRF